MLTPSSLKRKSKNVPPRGHRGEMLAPSNRKRKTKEHVPLHGHAGEMLTPSNPMSSSKAKSALVQIYDPTAKAVYGDVQKRKVCNLAVVNMPLVNIASSDLYSFGKLPPTAWSVDVIHNQRSIKSISGTEFDGYVVYKHHINSWRKVPRVTDVNYSSAHSTFPPANCVPVRAFELKLTR